MKALIFDSFFDTHRGVVAFVRVFEGSIKKSDELKFLATRFDAKALEVGYFRPDLIESPELNNGEVGYIVTGTKDLEMVRVGDTICDVMDKELALPGYKEVQSKVFSSIFPIDQSEYPKLRDAVAKLKLSDASLKTEAEHIPALGYGFRCGFLGLLHMDIVQERLSREYDMSIIMTTPSVEYKVNLTNGDNIIVHSPSGLPDPSQIQSIEEPWIKMELILPEEYVGKIIELVTSSRGNYTGLSQISAGQMQVIAELPLAEVIVDFYDTLKSATKGYATFSYEPIGFRMGDLVKVDFLVNKIVVEPMAIICDRARSVNKGKVICEKLKKLIPRQQFEIAVQAAIGSKVIARETIQAFRKDVTAKLYGGDVSRRKKLLEKQKKGKKKMKMIGNVEIPQSAFMSVMKK